VVTSAAIRVPTLVPTSWAVSLRAVPIDVRLAGIASTRAIAQIVITVRSPIVITTMQTAMAAYPWSTPQARPARAAARQVASTRQATRCPKRLPSYSDSGVATITVTMTGRSAWPARTGLHPGVLEVQDQPEHHVGHRDGLTDLGDGRAADGAAGEDSEVENGCGAAARGVDEPRQGEMPHRIA
jgi:hypothetical protein